MNQILQKGQEGESIKKDTWVCQVLRTPSKGLAKGFLQTEENFH